MHLSSIEVCLFSLSGGVAHSRKGRRMLYRFTFLRKSKIKELSGVFGNSRGIYKQVVFQHLLCWVQRNVLSVIVQFLCVHPAVTMCSRYQKFMVSSNGSGPPQVY